MLSRLTYYRPRALRAVRLLRRPQTYGDLAREALWTSLPRRVRMLPPSWPLPDDRLRTLSILWPEESPWRGALRWVETIRDGLAGYVPIEYGDVEQPQVNTVVFAVRAGGENHAVAIDYADGVEIDVRLARSVALYFKLQFSEHGYSSERVRPGGYVVGQPQLFRYLLRLRQLRDRGHPVNDVYGRFGAHGQPVRRHVVRALEEQTGFDFAGSLETVLYVRSLREAARSRVCVDLPGRGAFCYRLADYLAIGSCIVAIPHRNRLHVPLRDGEHIAYAAPDGRDFLDRCEHYVLHDDERRELERNSREYFDRFLHPHQLGAYYLSTIVESLFT